MFFFQSDFDGHPKFRCLFACVAILFTSYQSIAQKQFRVVYGADGGFNQGVTRYRQNGNVLRNLYQKSESANGYYITPYTAYAGLNYRMTRHFAVESGVVGSQAYLEVHDTQYQQRNNISSLPDPPYNQQGTTLDRGSFLAFHYYNGVYFSTYLHFGDFYIQTGLTSNLYPGWTPMGTTSWQSTTGEVLQMNYHYAHRYISPFVEIGSYLTAPSGKGRHSSSCFLFIRGAISGTVITGDYRDSQNGIIINSDHVTVNANRISFGARIALGPYGKSMKSEDRAVHNRYHHSEKKKLHRQMANGPFRRRHSAYKPKPLRKTSVKHVKKENSAPAMNPDNVKSYRHSF